MLTISVNGKDYVIGSFIAGSLEGALYRLDQRDIGRVQVPVRKNSLEAKRVLAAFSAR